jgi:hypothetical protein
MNSNTGTKAITTTRSSSASGHIQGGGDGKQRVKETNPTRSDTKKKSPLKIPDL